LVLQALIQQAHGTGSSAHWNIHF